MDTSAEPPRVSSSCTLSPEFEFWMAGKTPSVPQTHLAAADELFVDGVVLPLDHLSLTPLPDRVSHSTAPRPCVPQPEAEPAPTSPPRSYNWKHLIKAGEKAMEEIIKRKNKKKTSTMTSRRGGVWSNSGISYWRRAKAAVAASKIRGDSSSSRRFAGGFRLGRTGNVWKLQGKGRKPHQEKMKESSGSKNAGGGNNGVMFTIKSIFSKKVQ
ncbi:hypothetical protein Cni_G03188 [Canna indica]|uniref:Uncharacterized protein n=1 Tax=Canna indica TaxID=4628 RepID=A0AAQ3JRG1_9LILI|nr:hypothetical protein Cni_G03188 [Canna indica]